jgi:hypothetical protein
LEKISRKLISVGVEFTCGTNCGIFGSIISYATAPPSVINPSSIYVIVSSQVFRKMPLFSKSKKGDKPPREVTDDTMSATPNGSTPAATQNANSTAPAANPDQPAPAKSRPKLVFHCQQAHGSPTGVISGFTNVKELYQKIAQCYDMDPSEVGVSKLQSGIIVEFYVSALLN